MKLQLLTARGGFALNIKKIDRKKREQANNHLFSFVFFVVQALLLLIFLLKVGRDGRRFNSCLYPSMAIYFFFLYLRSGFLLGTVNIRVPFSNLALISSSDTFSPT